MSTEQRDPKRWWILAVLCLSLLTIVLDNTVLNVAIPSITSGLGASTAQIQWMLDAYTLVLSGLLITAGGLSDRYGRKRALVLGLALFGVGSLLGAYASSPSMLITGRAVMGVGAAFLMPGTLATLVRTFDNEERPKAIGVWAAVSSAGMALGPVLGGFLLNHFWWGSALLINVPVTLVAGVAIAILLPESSDPGHSRPDLLGAALSTTASVALVWAVVSVPRDGWLAPQTLGAAALGVLALGVFSWWERRVEDPMLDLSMFSHPKFRGAVLGGILTSFGMGGSLFLLTQDLQFVRGYSPLDAGAQITPMAVSVLLTSIFLSARVLRALGVGRSVALGVTVSAAGLLAIGLAPQGGSYAVLVVGLVLLGAGAGISGPVVANALMSSIPPARASTGSGVNSTLQELGSGLGVGVLGAILVSGYAARLPRGLGGRAGGSYPDGVAAAAHRPDSAAALSKVHHAFLNSMTVSQLIGAAAVLLGGWCAGAMLYRAERAEKSLTGLADSEVAAERIS